MNLDYTLCFLTRGNEVLLLHRRKPPNRGKWNGVGGRLERGETPLAACLREVREETGYVLGAARFAGLLTWTGFEIADGGLYLFLAEAPAGEPRANAEGELRWWPKAEACRAPEVVSNLHLILPHLFAGAPPQTYQLTYRDGLLIEHSIEPLPEHATRVTDERP
jgi:8-oxo-dGTP diphosphatase